MYLLPATSEKLKMNPVRDKQIGIILNDFFVILL